MTLPPVVLLSPPIIAALYTIVLSVVLWVRRKNSSGITLFWMMVWLAVASTAETLEILTFSPEARSTYLSLEYSANLLMMTYWFIFVWKYTHHNATPPRWLARILWSGVLIGIILNYTNAFHHLAWRGISWSIETLFTSASPVYGIGLLAQEIWILCLGLASIALLSRKFYSTRGLLRSQISFILIGGLILEIGFLLEPGDINPIAPLNPLPIAVILSSLLLTWSMLRQNLLTLPLVAREQILDRIPVFVMALDERQRILDLNVPMEKALGDSALHLIGKSASEVLWPEILPYLEEGGEEEAQVASLQISGEQRYYKVQATALRPVAGQLLLMSDITLEYRFQEEARVTDTRLRGFFEHSPDLLMIKDAVGRWIFANQAILALFDLTDIDYAGKTDQELATLVPHHRAALLHSAEKDRIAWKNGKTFYSDEAISMPDGQMRFFDIIRIPRFSPDGTPGELIFHARDNTRQKQAEQNLRQKAVQLQLLLEISANMNSRQTPEAVYAYLCQQSIELLAADDGRVYINEPHKQQMRCVYNFGKNEDCTTYIAPYGTGVAGNIAITGKPLLIEDYPRWEQKLPRYTNQPLPYHSVIGVPLLWQGEAQAALLVFRKENYPAFSLEEMDLLMLLANQASGVLKSAVLLERESEQRQLAESLQHIALSLNASLEPKEVYQRLLEEAGKLVPYDSATLMQIDGDIVRLVASIGYEKFLTPAQLPYLQELTFPLKETPNLFYITTTKRSYVIPNVLDDPEWVVVPEGRHIRSWIGIPIFIQGEPTMIFSLDSTTPYAYQKHHLTVLTMFASHATLAIQNAHLFAQIRALALNDELTNLPNRRYLFTMGKREIQRARRFGHPLSALMIDIDHFKHVNDTYGHLIGDEVLRTLAARCRNTIREVDIIGRYGGEEFAVLLPDTNLTDALQIGERLRKTIANEAIVTSGGKLSLTISVGAAELREDISDLQDLLDIADQGLYMAKQNGRNRVMSIQNINPMLTNF